MLTREELKKEFAKDSNEPEEVINRMVDVSIENMYGSEEEYQKKLAAAREAEKKEFKPSITDEEYNELRQQFDEEAREIKHPEAAKKYLIMKETATHSGIPEEVADLEARTQLEQEYGPDLYGETEEVQFERLENLGFYLTEADKRAVKNLMNTLGLDALDAARRVQTEYERKQWQERRQYEEADDEEREFLDLLSPADKRILAQLKALQPDSNWTAKKFYHREYGRKPRKPKQEEQEETVSWEEYEKERKKNEELKKQVEQLELENTVNRWRRYYGDDAIREAVAQVEAAGQPVTPEAVEKVLEGAL